MAKKENDGFTVTDRRLFTSDGDLRGEQERSEAEIKSQAPVPEPEPEAAAGTTAPTPETVEAETPAGMGDPGGEAPPPPPTAAEQQQQADAYKKSATEMDRRAELGGHSARDLEMTFERFLASMYMTAMLQLGLMHEQGGQPRPDLIAARQTIDTIALINDKTKGNLTQSESEFLQNCLYEVRMAYVEVTNTLAHPPQAPSGGGVIR